MTKRIERIIDAKELKKDDVIIYKYAGKVERYIVKAVDSVSIKTVPEDGPVSTRIFPLKTLVTDSWYVERERGSYERKKSL